MDPSRYRTRYRQPVRRPRVGMRLTRVSTPFGGASWEAVPNVEAEVLGRLVTFLKDRCVLYDPTEVEIPPHCVDSVLRIREVLIDLAGRLPRDGEVGTILRNMAGACRGFLDHLPDELTPGRLGRPPKEGAEIRTRLQRLGILRESRHEHLNGSLVVPVIDEAGRVTEMYGRKITWDTKAPAGDAAAPRVRSRVMARTHQQVWGDGKG